MFPFFRRSPPVLVRLLDGERAPDCAAIHRTCFAHPWSATEIEAMIASANSVSHEAVDSRTDGLIGFIISRRVLDEAEVLTIAVSPELRRHGVASSLLQEHLEALAMERVLRLFLEVEEGNVAARKLYEKFGFLEAGRREGYYRLADGGRAAALILRKNLI